MKRVILFLLLTAMAMAQNGRIKVSFVEPKSEISRAIHQSFISDKDNSIQYLMDIISNEFKLPRQIDVIFAETGDVNAWYDPEKHQVIMTYDLIEYLVKDALQQKSDKDQAVQYATGAIIFTLMHEMSHALIGEMDVPVVGREEDAADELATIIMLEDSANGHQFLFSAMDWFAAMSDRRKEHAYWDEHSLDKQRLFNILLLMYGHSPDKYRQLTSRLVPAGRMAKAIFEYKTKTHRWGKLLQPYVRVNQ